MSADRWVDIVQASLNGQKVTLSALVRLCERAYRMGLAEQGREARDVQNQRSREWFVKMRAKGICYICHRPMADDDDRMAHTECNRAVNRGQRWLEIRRNPPPLSDL